jgi:hypothetical protein
MSGIDESVANLEQFIGEASSASSYLVSASSRLDKVSGAIDTTEQDAQDDIGDTNEVLATAETRLGEARTAAIGALETLAQSAEEAQGAIDEKQGALDDAAGEAEDGAGDARDDLDDGYDRISADGFREHTAAAEDLGAAADGAADEATGIFGRLSDGLTELTTRAGTLRESVSGGLGDTEAAVEEETEGLGDRFDAVKETWHQQIDDVLSQECSATGDELHGAYAAWGDAVGEVADELRESCAKPAGELASFLDEDAHQALEQAVGELLRGEADQLLAEEGLCAAGSEAAGAISEALAEIVGDLRVSVNVVGEIDRLLDELKG